ncbi:E3 ubiquitin-protein ligase UPL7 (Ubiquitin-protein ligase 7) (HECT-type E3 ubiquitin transferase UPL7) [Durusdinium trenchii]|uniref:HECT-type E3 ubiquitin transferase n=1 Tax=Durusdinium trenchii TaxID=1381693 RepID=A0ABP0QLR3_9DINO
MVPQEQGQDAGGLFKEFWEKFLELSRRETGQLSGGLRVLSICSESPQCQGGDVSELCLNFVATDGEGKEVPLLPNGQEMPVTVENRVKRFQAQQGQELHQASAAFLAGFRSLIDEKWLSMLSEHELQQVISGSSGGSLDVDDLQRHTELSNCSGHRDRMVLLGGNRPAAFQGKDFFTALRAMKPEHQVFGATSEAELTSTNPLTSVDVKLLRFVTSCSRAPLLGFSHLQPPFTLHKVHIRSDSEKLPTASTWKVMKEKLEFVIVQVLVAALELAGVAQEEDAATYRAAYEEAKEAGVDERKLSEAEDRDRPKTSTELSRGNGMLGVFKWAWCFQVMVG